MSQTPGDKNTFDPGLYFVCFEAPSTVFEMRVSDFAGPNNFTLEISHSYKDTS